MSAPIRVGLVGHCGADARALKRMVQRAASDGPVEVVDLPNRRRLESQLGSLRAALVNRRLEGAFDATDGVELIDQLRDRTAAVGCALLLVSDQEDAQRRAEQAGAAAGFGKSELRTDDARRRLVEALRLDEAPTRSANEKPGDPKTAGSSGDWLARLRGRLR